MYVTLQYFLCKYCFETNRERGRRRERELPSTRSLSRSPDGFLWPGKSQNPEVLSSFTSGGGGGVEAQTQGKFFPAFLNPS